MKEAKLLGKSLIHCRFFIYKVGKSFVFIVKNRKYRKKWHIHLYMSFFFVILYAELCFEDMIQRLNSDAVGQWYESNMPEGCPPDGCI